MAVLNQCRNIPSNPPLLEAGDVLTRTEFERRYTAMPDLKKAELIEGVVYLHYQVKAASHGIPHAQLGTLLRIYSMKHEGLIVASNSTVRLDTLNEPQPDLLLMRENGHAHLDADGYISGAPELIAEIAASSVSYDLHQKKRTYQRAGVLEYLVWLAEENRLIWWQLLNDDYVEILPSAAGLLESVNFPGLIIDGSALTSGDLATALSRLE